jgi:hypothetical protein
VKAHAGSTPVPSARKEMAKIKKINTLSLAKFQAVLFALLGLVAGIIYSFGGLIVDTLVSIDLISTKETPGLNYGTVLAFGALLGMPAIGFLIGVITGFVEAILYNLFAKLTGGVELDFEQ